jgi:hypothetical protein
MRRALVRRVETALAVLGRFAGLQNHAASDEELGFPRRVVQLTSVGKTMVLKVSRSALVKNVYYEEESGRRSAANLMTKDEARRIAAKVAKLPDLLGRPQY